MFDFRSLTAELVKTLTAWQFDFYFDKPTVDLLERANTALNQTASIDPGPAGGNYREVWDMSSKYGSLCFASAILSRLVGVDVLDEADLQWLAAYLQANSTPQGSYGLPADHDHPSLSAAERNPNLR
jgi:hypothetical protein